ncbi:rubrerythrin family protein [Candidatus Pacearchaeota archaeon]|jgi:rubrerythrin|nr:rubrerythrin family protein [Candidatus Pacearchaeota archaeon]|tara:strand:- start:42 stop:626 length:585 start_codon:yes stop_codon:yes gene_type:complete
MPNLKGTQTEKNLLKAFAGESQARNRYTYFASVAKKQGYEQIASIFLETAEDEKEHAKIFFKHLQESGGELLEISAEYPAGKIGTTEENLLAAAEGEKAEWGTIYPNFKEVIEKEGFSNIAESFKEIAEVEEKHEKRYRKLLENVKNKTVFKKSSSVEWKCRNCGYVHKGDTAPESCPACKHPQAYYELLAENY